MTPNRTPWRQRILPLCLLLLAAVAFLLPPGQPAEAADDLELLRRNAADPFVMVLIDTSASMGLAPPDANDKNSYIGDLTAAHGDDPASKLFQTKRALYEVFSKTENISFGLTTYNKDHLRVLRKHWLYEPLRSVDFTAGLSYPTTASRNADGSLSRREALEHFWIFGDPVNGGVAGTCANPVEFSTQDQDNTDILLNRFPKVFGASDVTSMWIGLSNTPYLLEITRSDATSFSTTDADGNTVTTDVGGLGADHILVDLSLREATDCSGPTLGTAETFSVPFRVVTDFLRVESDVFTDAPNSNKDPGVRSEEALAPNTDFLGADACGKDEMLAGFYNIQDVLADGTCGFDDGGPFSGEGWEGSWDSGPRSGLEERDNRSYDNFDPFCGLGSAAQAPDDLNGCYNLRWPTRFHPEHPELDVGDFIPLDWQVDHREEFLRRINPRHPDYPAERFWDNSGTDDLQDEAFLPYFGVARFFNDAARPGDPAPSGVLRLRNPERRPLAAYGHSPLNRVLTDIRSWYLGPDANRNHAPQFDPGFEPLFRAQDVAFNCRLPYLIVITDGEMNTDGQNETTPINTLDGEAGMRTWIFTFGETQVMQSIASTTGASVTPVSSGDQLRTELEEVVGTITTETRTFATAAVPSVQATVESRIYLTKFQPLNDAGVWEGHLHAFDLPMPTGQTEPPNGAYPNHIWDAAVSLLDQSPPPPEDGDLSTVSDLQLGDGVNERRVLWAREKVGDSSGLTQSPAVGRLFDTTEAPSSGGFSEEEADLWRAMEIPFDPNDSESVEEAREEGNEVVKGTLVQKESTVDSDTDDLTTYILGEIFHSNPLVVGGPINTNYFVEDAEERLDADGVQEGIGYREFFNKHENRRKMVITGANDGMLHAFEAGVPGVETVDSVPEVRFTKGTGYELFSFIPREIMPTVKLTAQNARTHRWSVDGSPAGGDVFIDPVHTGTPSSEDRNWRTVVVTGLREGGSGYFALDITQPDPLTTATVGPADEPVAERDVSLIDNHPTGTGEGALSIPTPNGLIVPGCYNEPGDGTPGCDELEYPAPLWEFSDRVWDKVNERWVRLDEDENGKPDLAESWSTPNIGRIKVDEGGEEVNKYVAIFGGGLDPDKVGHRGNWLFIVDIETGRAIYKRELDGSAPSDPAAVDTDQDGFFDRVYLGTTNGFLYRLDLTAVDADGDRVFPALTTRTACGVDGICNYDVTRFEEGSGTDPLWAPQKIFDANVYTADGPVRRPIYFPPAVLSVADLGEHAVAFGTGDRDDLTSRSEADGRFYVFVDETAQLADSALPMTEADLERIDREEGNNPDLLTDPDLPIGEKGWFLVLNGDERLIGDPFGFSGITFFASFEPKPEVSCAVVGDDSTRECSDDEAPECSLKGTSRVYVVGTTNADAFLEDDTGQLSRSFDIQDEFITSPFTEQAVTTTTNVDTDGDGVPDDEVEANPLDEAEEKVMQKLMELFPDRCKFGNHRIDIKVIEATSEVQRIAAVPICIIEKNWREVSQ